MAQHRIVALVSGGLDSCCLVQLLLKRGTTVFPLSVRCGLVWEEAELFWLRRWLAQVRHPRLNSLKTLEVPVHAMYAHHWSLTARGIPSARSRDTAVYLPGRNVLLLSHAAVYAVEQGLSTLAMGTLAGNPFGDARPNFLKRFATCLSQALSKPLKIETPLRRFTKARLIKTFPKQPFELTFSCLQPQGTRHCGQCNKCAERQHAFRRAGIPDPTTYVG